MKKKWVKKSNWWSGAIVSGYSSEYQTILDFATTNSIPLPSDSKKAAQNAHLVRKKSNGSWDLSDAYWVFLNDSGNIQFGSINWKNPAVNRVTFPVSPSHTDNQGIGGNGTTQYANSNFNPATHGVNYQLNNCSVYCHIFNHVTEAKFDLGVAPNFTGGTPCTYIRGDEGFGSSVYAINQQFSGSVANSGNAAGFYLNQRKDSGNIFLFKNGIQIDTEADASTTVPNGNIFLLAINNGGSAANFTTRKLSCTGIGASMSGLESAMYTDWNTYLTS